MVIDLFMSNRGSIFFLVLISLVFSIIVGSGFYGFGIDFYASYIKPNYNSRFELDNWLGYRLSTLTIYNQHLGVYLLTFIISFTTGKLMLEFLKLKSINSNFLFILIFIITLHTWPVIMSTVNAMRQGYCMSVIFISFLFMLKGNLKLSFLFFFLSIFLHTSGLLFFFIFIIFLILKKLIQFLNERSKNLFLLFAGSFLILNIIFFFDIFLDTTLKHRIIKGDFRLHFLFINLIYIFFYIFKYSFFKKNDIALYIFLFSCAVIPFLIYGLNWQYERLNMMMILPYIFIFSLIFKKNSCEFYWIFTMLSLLFFTFYQNIYKSLY